jgi:hypothetical protein
VTFTLDLSAPSITISGVVDGGRYTGAVSAAIAVTDAHPGTVTTTLDGAAYASGTAIAVNGHHTIAVEARDAAGNVSSRAVAFRVVSRDFGVSFFTLAPCRLVDTRWAAGPLGGPALTAGHPRTFAMAGACGVPADALALSLNVSVTRPTQPGFITLYDASLGTNPAVATVTFRAGQTRSNNAVINTANDESAALKAVLASGSADLVIDVNGYFGVAPLADPRSGSGALAAAPAKRPDAPRRRAPKAGQR